ncbi:XapX domain-containing protein [Geobacillus sp. JS12]|uniref:XapX domain-containing protein n=1 Tax=Geobacillus sp. JS12 TaxID=1813182 RepID=UPI002689DE19
MKEIVLSLLTGMIVGFLFTLLRLPIPAPRRWPALPASSGCISACGCFNGSRCFGSKHLHDQTGNKTRLAPFWQHQAAGSAGRVFCFFCCLRGKWNFGPVKARRR